jgi:hypothetical protein
MKISVKYTALARISENPTFDLVLIWLLIIVWLKIFISFKIMLAEVLFLRI